VPPATSLLLGAVEAVTEPDAGSWSSRGRSLLLRAVRVSFFRSPPVPRAAPQAGKSGKEEARMEEVTDEPLYRDRVCGIDIGKAGLVATIRVPSDRDPRRAQVAVLTVNGSSL
jgi:hypothetical protein